MKKIIGGGLLLLLGVLVWALCWPLPVEPVAWHAPQAPALDGIYAVNRELRNATLLAEGVGVGPETVITDAQGNLYTGYADGRLLRFTPTGDAPQVIANTQGRPLGLAFAADGKLLVADGRRGLLRVDVTSGVIQELATTAAGVPFGFVDDVAVASDGTVYFSDASSVFGPDNFGQDDVLMHAGLGRLLAYDPASRSTRVLLDKLQFANGVTLAADESYVLVTESGNYDVLRYWLKGDKAGQHEVFVANLPGIPDNISSNGRGTYWLALYTSRNALLDAVSPYPSVRRLVYRLPGWLRPPPAHHAFVLGLDEQGRVAYNLQDEGMDAFAPITNVHEDRGRLWLGSVKRDGFAVYPLRKNDAPLPAAKIN